MNYRFKNRREAGRRVADRLSLYRERPEVLVLALPRGGVPVAREIAAALHAPLDLLIVRKLGLPGDEELAMGAVAANGVQVLNRRLIASFGVPASEVARAVARERREVARREAACRGDSPPLVLRGRTVILVDDGVATGATMRAAIAVVRAEHASRVVVATPVIAREAYLELRAKADEFVALQIPKEFVAVGDFYTDFAPVGDEEVSRATAQAVG